MKFNRRRGATLGLVAVCVFVIILLAVGFFILAKIIGGEREVANATDAGVLIVARNAMSPTIVGVDFSSIGPNARDFIGLDENVTGLGNTGGRASMQNINRIVAQSVLVALNAQSLDTADAASNATTVANTAKQIATQLRNKLYNSNTLNGHFTGVAQKNNTKMWQGNKVNLVGNIQSAFMRPGYSTNVFIHPQTKTPVSPPSTLTNQNGGAATSSTDSAPYMAGYVNWSIPVGNGQNISIAGVPIFPQTQPHLVDKGEFDGHLSDPVAGGYLPPNAFKATSQAAEGTSGTLGGSLACAIVGVLDKDFAASIPRGYIRIANGEDANAQNPPLGDPVVDGTNDIFNNELWPPSSISVANNGTNSMFTDNANAMQAWVDYNADTTGTVSQPSTNGIYVITNDAAGYRQATVDDLADKTNHSDITTTAGATGSTACDTLNGWDQPACLFDPAGVVQGSMPYSASKAYNRYNVTGTPPSGSNGYTNIEYMKADLLRQRANGAKCATVTPPTLPSGMKKFNVGGCYNTSASNPNPAFGAVDTPKAYLNQISDGGANACANNIVKLIADRMTQVDHSINQGAVDAALSNASYKLGMGQTLVLYSPGPGLVTMAPINPGEYFNPAPPNLTDNDGRTSTQVIPCENTYRIDSTIIDSSKGAGSGPVCSIGDANYHQVPFTQSSPVTAVDRAVWTPASGYNNLLGDLKFENTALNGGTFCKPN
jgi:hypothetical protein